MRILYLTNGFPYPLTSGYLRHYFLTRELSERHEITLLSIVGPAFLASHATRLAPYCRQILTFRSSVRGGGLPRKAVTRLETLVRGGLADRAVREMRVAASDLHRKQRFDVALLSGKQTLPAIEHLEDVPVVADMCDATSVRLRGALRYAGPMRRAALGLDYVAVRRVEKRLVHTAAHLVFASGRDRAAIAGVANGRATVVPNGVDLEFWKRSTRARRPGVIVMTGAMDYAPNADAALFLIQEVLPRVRAEMPETKLLLVGRDPTPRLLEASAHSAGTTVTGFVDDVRPYLERATVFAAPLRFGAGIQNKLLEAMAMEVPAVVTPLAAEGVCGPDGQSAPVSVTGTAQEMARALSEALRQGNADASPHAEGRRFVARHFVWSESGRRLEQALTGVVGNKAGDGSCSA